MTTILYIPLDERPCNFMYPQALLESIEEPRVILKTSTGDLRPKEGTR